MKTKNKALQEMEQNHFIKNAYEQYHSFMGLNAKLPKVEILTHKINGTVLANHKMDNGKHFIRVQEKLPLLKDEALPYLFHEFTHVYDYETYFKGVEKQEMLLQLYTEYHASQIEFMKKLGFDNVEDRLVITANTNVTTFSKSQTVEQFLLEEKRGYIAKIRDYISLNNMQGLFDAFPFLMYYLGKIKVVIKYSENIDEWNINLFDYSEFAILFGNEIINIINDLLNIEIITEENIRPVIENQISIMKHFKTMA